MTVTDNSGSLTPTAPPLRVALIVASVRRERLADALLPWLREQVAGATPGGVRIELDVVDLRDLDPAGTPAAALRPGGSGSPVSDRLHAADAYLVLVPEYNHSFPGALKDLLDWHYAEWARKPVAFASYGASSGGVRAVEQLRLVFPELRATTVRDAVALVAPWQRLDGAGRFVASPAEADALDATLRELAWWGLALRRARHADTAAEPVPA